MRITVLGSGAWEGIPGPYLHNDVTRKAMLDMTSKDFRTRPSFLVENGDESFQIEISPDIRIQAAKHNIIPQKDFLITHWHFDHLYGILELHAYSIYVEKPNIYCSEQTGDWIRKNFSHIPLNLNILEAFKPFSLIGVQITPFPVSHMGPIDKNFEPQNNTFGYLLEDGGRKVSYLADYYHVPSRSRDIIRGSDVAIFDGTFLFSHLVPEDHPYHRLVLRDRDHLKHDDIVRLVEELGPRKAVFHSISYLTNRSHDELQRMLPTNYLISYDGMIL